MEYIGCKNLDYSSEFFDCQLIETPEGWRYWKRLKAAEQGLPVNVQFCKGRGRINEIFACINPGEKSCFEPQETINVVE